MEPHAGQGAQRKLDIHIREPLKNKNYITLKLIKNTEIRTR